ncbi:hypothetical protein EG68_07753 [Paragonimus skrjabini miyazakii]|uniref:Phosphorylase b kinase regulatory subunit n=1 Tax=Paragonimus skrjabini miyazakii TaxID=59628 RepID=A0A8S9YEV4_9TREM|nr:hypothetical protein EG68_07753 [Paragonimus skrjabini miyazakii]
MSRLKGQYGFRRFTRDGYATVLDRNTLYQPGELMKFQGIESEWPMFFAYMAIEHCMNNEFEKALEYDRLLQPLLVHPVSETYPWLPKFFYVPQEDLEKERKCRGSVVRKSSFRLPGESFFLWGQAVYLVSQLLIHHCLDASDLDPLGRCPAWTKNFGSPTHGKALLVDRPLNVTIQVVLISESARLQQILATYGVLTQTPLQVEPIQIWPPDQLVRVGKFMGCSENLGLSGRPPRPVGQLGTCRFYRISGLTVLCYPLLFEAQDFYLLHDMQVVIDEVKTDFKFLSDWWRLRGRPTFCFLIKEDMVKVAGFGQLLRFLVSMKNGTVHGTRIVLGRAQKFVSSGCVEHLDFLPLWTATGDYFHRLREVETGRSFRSLDDLPKEVGTIYAGSLKTKNNTSVNVPSGAEVVRIMHAMDRSRFRQCTDEKLIEHVFYPSDDAYSLSSRAAVLHELLERHGLDHVVVTSDHRCSVRDCLIDLSRVAGIQQAWCVVRLCAALLAQFVNSLAPSLSIILVCGKQVTVGVAQGPEMLVNKPLNPDELYKVLRETVYPHDQVQFSLQQELILWVSSLLTSDQNLFNGIKFIRLGWLVEAMKLQLEYETVNENPEHNTDDLSETPTSSTSGFDLFSNINQRSLGACHLYSLPPCMVKDLLFRTLRAGQFYGQTSNTDESFTSFDFKPESAVIPSPDNPIKNRRLRLRRKQVVTAYPSKESRPSSGSDKCLGSQDAGFSNALFQRQLDGCLGRVPTTFYQSLYTILERSPHGVLICNERLDQKPTLTDMTAYDLNFIDEVERLLRPIGDPAYRSLFVEAVMVIAVILGRNCELSFRDTVDIKMFIQDAMSAFSADRHGSGLSSDILDRAIDHSARVVRRLSWPEPDVAQAHDLATYTEFTATPANIHMGTTAYLAKATLDRLLQGHIDLSHVTKDACCAM